MKQEIESLLNSSEDYVEKWYYQAQSHLGKWTPFDHICFIHMTMGVRKSDYVIIAQSNDHILKHDLDGNIATSLQLYNQIKYEEAYKVYIAKIENGLNARKPRLQTKINWVQHPVLISSLYEVDARERINSMYENCFDAYVCMSATWASDSRRKETITSTNCIWVDIDCKDQFDFFNRPEDIAFYLLEFIDRHKVLPMPSAIVTSGGGVHVYWKTTAIPISADTRFSAMMTHLHAKIRVMGLVPDRNCVDQSRVLRLCKTRNSKYSESICELLWRPDTLGAAISFDDFCDLVFPMTRDEYNTFRAVKEFRNQNSLAKPSGNSSDGFSQNIYTKIKEDFDKLSVLDRFSKRPYRDIFLWNYAVTLTYVMPLKQINAVLNDLCKEMEIPFAEFKPFLKTVYVRVLDKSLKKYRLSVGRVISQLDITEDEMLVLNLRVLKTSAIRRIHKRQAKAASRGQNTPPRSKEDLNKLREVSMKRVINLLAQKLPVTDVASQLGVSRSTIYRWQRQRNINSKD